MSLHRIADIVFLIDESGSMAEHMNMVKDSIRCSLHEFESLAFKNFPVKEWRMKVVGFRDCESAGPERWLDNNPFAASIEEAELQLDGIHPDGGSGIAPRSLLDALYTVINIGTTGRDESPDPNKWRHKAFAYQRIVFVFTDAPFKPELSIPDAAGLNAEMIVRLIEKEKLIVVYFAPDDPCYFNLASAMRSDWWLLSEKELLFERRIDRVVHNHLNKGYSFIPEDEQDAFPC